MISIPKGMQIAMLSDEERGRKRKILNDYLYSHLRHHRMYAYKYFFCEFICFLNVTAQFYVSLRFERSHLEFSLTLYLFLFLKFKVN